MTRPASNRHALHNVFALVDIPPHFTQALRSPTRGLALHLEHNSASLHPQAELGVQQNPWPVSHIWHLGSITVDHWG